MTAIRDLIDSFLRKYTSAAGRDALAPIFTDHATYLLQQEHARAQRAFKKDAYIAVVALQRLRYKCDHYVKVLSRYT